MLDIPNPFKLLDILLLDYVFNPISWWSSERLNRDAVDLGNYCVYAGSCFVFVSLLLLDQVYVALFSGFLSGVSCSHRRYARLLWIKNNKTGRNRLRETNWIVRTNILIVDIFFSIVALVLTSLFYKTTFIENQTVLQFISYTFVIGMWLTNALPGYFDATDGQPPSIKQQKLVL